MKSWRPEAKQAARVSAEVLFLRAEKISQNEQDIGWTLR
jgi:hypothetical protein